MKKERNKKRGRKEENTGIFIRAKNPFQSPLGGFGPAPAALISCRISRVSANLICHLFSLRMCIQWGVKGPPLPSSVSLCLCFATCDSRRDAKWEWESGRECERDHRHGVAPSAYLCHKPSAPDHLTEDNDIATLRAGTSEEESQVVALWGGREVDDDKGSQEKLTRTLPGAPRGGTFDPQSDCVMY